MEIVTTIAVIVAWLSTVVLARLVTTTVHELGHAFPALWYTKEAVNVHVGSYGVEKGNKLLNVGRLKLFFRFNILHANLGLCQHSRPATYVHQLLIILGGPLFSLALSGVTLILILIFPFSDVVIGFLMIFVLSALWDFFVNIFPFSNPVRLENGGFTYNDGRQLIETWREMRYPPSYFEGLVALQQNDLAQARDKFRKTITQGFKDRQIYYLLIDALRAEEKPKPAIECFEEFSQYHKLKPEDYRLLGTLCVENGQYLKAIECLDQCIYYNFRNAAAYNERGLLFLKIGHIEKAISDFRMALHHDFRYTPAYENLGHALLKNGQEAEGNKYLQKARAQVK